MRREAGRFRGRSARVWRAALIAALLASAGAALAVPAPEGGGSLESFAVRREGRWALVRYTTKGEARQRFTGFERISDFAMLDDASVLVAEEEADRLTAVGFDGKILFEVRVQRPRCLQVLSSDRFLVCQDGPARVVEIDRTGHVFWQVSAPLVDAVGALRLADGNTAVVEGRAPSHAVRVLDPDGKILWTGTDQLAQPRGLALMPSGEIVTSGFDTARIVFFRPYTNQVRTLPFCCHGDKPTTDRQGRLIMASNELQIVRAWAVDGRDLWQFSTFYPPQQGLALSDGTVLVSEYRMPDRQCLHAAEAARNRQAPLAPYWWSLMAGIAAGGALIGALMMARRRARARQVADPSTEAAPEPAISGRRRLEIGLYCVAITALVAIAARWHAAALPFAALPGWPYVAVTVAGGALLALLEWRLPHRRDDWTERMRALAPMPRSSWLVRSLWLAGAVAAGVALEGVLHQRGPWVPGLWIAAIIVLAGAASIDRPLARPRPLVLAISAAALALLFGLRIYRLASYPANLHQDMTQWTMQAIRLLDGQTTTIFTNGWADIPLIGYLWSAVIDGLGDRSVGAVRLPAAIAGVVAIGATYLLVARLYGRATAAVAALLLALDRVFLHFSRIEAYMDPVPFHVLGVLGLVAAVETGKLGWFALAGLAGGYATLTYHAGRITPPALALLAGILVLRYPRVIARRWSGLFLTFAVAGAVIGPQIMVYLGGWANPYGRSDQFVWARGGVIDYAELRAALERGLPRVFGSFWLYGDSSTQYGGSVAFHPAVAALLGMAVVAAFVRLSDVRGIALVLWTSLILFIGGVLTVDPPFWPRLVTALVPATILAATAAGWLIRGAEAAAGRAGQVVAIAAALVLLGLDAHYQFDAYRSFVLGSAPGSNIPVRRTEWVQSVMGRDIQNWRDAMVYIVAPNPIDHSCEHPTMQYYAYDVDVRDARDISEYLPFDPKRTTVVYAVLERSEAVRAVLQAYPGVETKTFTDNVGRPVFVRVVVPAAT